MPSGIQSDVATQGADPATANSVLMTSLAQLSAASDMREFLAHVFAEILRVTGASNVAATRYDPRTNQLRLELFHDGSEARWGVSGNEIGLAPKAETTG